MYENNMKNTIEIYSTDDKIIVKNLQDHTDNLKNTIKNIEEILVTKSSKNKNANECLFEKINIDALKKYLIENLKIDEKDINIFSPEKEQCLDEQKKKEKLVLNKINKKIGLQLVKEKNKNKTFLTNINYFIDKNEIAIFCKKLQKILGSSSTINQEGDCGFSGDYTTDTAKKEIIKKFIFDNAEIKKENLDF